jgi:hypothetical protein
MLAVAQFGSQSAVQLPNLAHHGFYIGGTNLVDGANIAGLDDGTDPSVTVDASTSLQRSRSKLIKKKPPHV